MTDEQEDIAGRIDNLEMQIAYQNEVIDVLNKTVIEQWTKLDQALARIKLLEDRLREIQASVVRDVADEVPPPHY
jgi:SlyX protein